MKRFKIPAQVLGGDGPIPGVALKPTIFVSETMETGVSEDGTHLVDVKRIVLQFFWKLEPKTAYRFLFTDFETDTHGETEQSNLDNDKPRWWGAQIVNPFDPPRPHWPMMIPK